MSIWNHQKIGDLDYFVNLDFFVILELLVILQILVNLGYFVKLDCFVNLNFTECHFEAKRLILCLFETTYFLPFPFQKSRYPSFWPTPFSWTFIYMPKNNYIINDNICSEKKYYQFFNRNSHELRCFLFFWYNQKQITKKWSLGGLKNNNKINGRK